MDTVVKTCEKIWASLSAPSAGGRRPTASACRVRVTSHWSSESRLGSSFVTRHSSFIFFLIFLLLFTGCSVSRHYVGFQYVKGDYKYGFVSRKTEKQAKTFEIKCIKILLGKSSAGINQIFSEKLYRSIPRDSLSLISSVLQQRYHATGHFRILDSELNVRKSMGDPVLKEDGLRYYDFVRVTYIIQGQRDARVELFITRIYGELKLCGIKIRDTDYGTLGNRFEIQWLQPESF